MRKNPHIGTDRNGYLLNPQFTEGALGRGADTRYHDDTTLWVHSTDDDVSNWRDPDFKIQGERFYIGGGANAKQFGRNLVFLKYKPTKVFDYDDISHGYSDLTGFFECLYDELRRQREPVIDHFFQTHAHLIEDLMGDGEIEDVDHTTSSLADVSRETVIRLLKAGLATSNFVFFETPYVQTCLKRFGYTAYYESEFARGLETPYDEVNLAVLEPDFDNIEIVGVLMSDSDSHSYTCPTCNTPYQSLDDILLSTFTAGSVMCGECLKSEPCSLCERPTKESDIADEEYDSWGEREIICTTCESERKCEYCEAYFEPDDLGEATRTTSNYFGTAATKYRVCESCFEENRDDFDDDPLRKNPSREWFDTQNLQNDENGFLINPDTNDIYWYHGSRYGDCGSDWSDSGHRYLSSDIETAQYFMNEDALDNNQRCVVCEHTVQIPASQIYDARKDQDGTIRPDRIGDLDYQNYDYLQDTEVYALGDYKGFLEVEGQFFKRSTPAHLGIHLSHNHLLRVTREIEYCPSCRQAEVIDRGDFRECPKCSFKIKDCDSCSGWFEVGESCTWCEDGE